MGEIIGNIHSIETCGTVDGPGIRFVVFMQGCPMRCQYCHNPDTWDITRYNEQLLPTQILDKYNGVKEFCKGGITVTGGEPLMQMPFVTELFRLAHENNIHTALDTSGILFNRSDTKNIDKLLEYTSLVLLDIKHIDDEKHKILTGHSNKNVLDFAQYLSEINKPMWIRHVVVPEITYIEEDLNALGQFLSKLNNIKALDVLPYHNMAIEKYKNLRIKYPLEGTPVLSKPDAITARNFILEGMRKGSIK